MARSCFVCVLKPLVYVNYFSYGFVEVKCPHSSTANKPLILRNVHRWRATFVIHVVFTIMIAVTLYLNVTDEQEFDYFLLFTGSELVSAQIGLIRLIGENIGWKQRLQELQMMLSVWNYVGTFGTKTCHFILDYKFSVTACVFIAILNVLSVTYFFCNAHISYLTFLNVFTRLSVATLITGTYVYIIYEFFLYRLLFKWTFEQVERELASRLATTMVVYQNSRFYGQSGFARKIKKLRKLYVVVLYNFYRYKRIRRVYMSFVILIYHFLLILIIFLTFVVTRGVMTVHVGHILYVVKYIAYFMYLGAIFIICDDVQDLLQQCLTALFKVPLHILNPEEAREVELLIKFLTWEQPSNNSRDIPVYRMNLMMNIVVDIITNAMVVIQLYFWFTKKG